MAGEGGDVVVGERVGDLAQAEVGEGGELAEGVDEGVEGGAGAGVVRVAFEPEALEGRLVAEGLVEGEGVAHGVAFEFELGEGDGGGEEDGGQQGRGAEEVGEGNGAEGFAFLEPGDGVEEGVVVAVLEVGADVFGQEEGDEVGASLEQGQCGHGVCGDAAELQLRQGFAVGVQGGESLGSDGGLAEDLKRLEGLRAETVKKSG